MVQQLQLSESYKTKGSEGLIKAIWIYGSSVGNNLKSIQITTKYRY